jgi:hypothetical protein
MTIQRNPGMHPVRLKKSDWMIISFCWLLTQIFLLRFIGIYDKEESIKYIQIANQWMYGERNFNFYDIFYSGYSAIHIILQSIGLTYKSMYVVQLIFSALAVYYYQKTVSLFLYSRQAVLVSVLLYATCYIIQSWVCILFTDSIFCSLLMITVYFLLLESRTTGNKWVFWTLIFVLPFFRPVGFLFIAVSCLYWILSSPRENRIKLLVCAVYLLLIGAAIYKTFLPSESYYYPIHSLHNIRADVICGDQGNFLEFQKVPYREGMSIFSYLLQNPGMTARLFITRFYKVFSMGRSYFSPMHNRLLFISTFLYYVLAILGMIEIFLRRKNVFYMLTAGIMLFSFPLVIFCVEWSGRFSLPVIDFVFLFIAFGMDSVFRFSARLRKS